MKKIKTFVIGDIHGNYKALKQCLERSGFDYEMDKLICLGDVCDRFPETPQCIEELLKIKKLTYVMGNHDQWLKDWFKEGKQPMIWTEQGGQATIDSYLNNPELMVKHRDFFDDKRYAYIDLYKRLFVHGGYDRSKRSLCDQDQHYLMWDRSLFDEAVRDPGFQKCPFYKEVFIGHSPTLDYKPKFQPINRQNLWMLDTGGGYNGKLTIMQLGDIGKPFWQSDLVEDLYPKTPFKPYNYP